jgi:hypothetical protein
MRLAIKWAGVTRDYTITLHRRRIVNRVAAIYCGTSHRSKPFAHTSITVAASSFEAGALPP